MNMLIIDLLVLAKFLGSIRSGVSLYVYQGSPVLNQLINKSYYHSKSKVFVCNQWAYAVNHADVVDRLLILFHIIVFALSARGNSCYIWH